MRIFAGLIFSLFLTSATAVAQERMPSHCIAVADLNPALRYVHRASYRDPLPDYTVRISYLDHSMFLIQSANGPSVVTDFAGYLGATDFLPDVVTMNHAHSSHWTPFVHPDIPHVLPGWGEVYGQGIDHYLMLDDMIIRNVSTDIRSGGGVETEGNSIFVFEIDGLCIGHLGHLHHEPDEAQYAALGRLDVVMAAVDGGMSLDTVTMSRIVGRLKSSVVLPMHWFGRGTLEYFLDGMSDEFAIRREPGNSIELSLRSLPDRPTIIVLEPRLLD